VGFSFCFTDRPQSFFGLAVDSPYYPPPPSSSLLLLPDIEKPSALPFCHFRSWCRFFPPLSLLLPPFCDYSRLLSTGEARPADRYFDEVGYDLVTMILLVAQCFGNMWPHAGVVAQHGIPPEPAFLFLSPPLSPSYPPTPLVGH